MATQAEMLRTKFEKLKGEGLEDIKFAFGPLSEETTESVCESINDALDAIAAGKVSDLVIGESRLKR